jgi:hypothetical protein
MARLAAGQYFEGGFGKKGIFPNRRRPFKRIHREFLPGF